MEAKISEILGTSYKEITLASRHSEEGHAQKMGQHPPAPCMQGQGEGGDRRVPHPSGEGEDKQGSGGRPRVQVVQPEERRRNERRVFGGIHESRGDVHRLE